MTSGVSASLAIHGGRPVRERMLPYGGQWVDESDIQEVVRVLQSDRLTTGPLVEEFERSFATLGSGRDAFFGELCANFIHLGL